MTRRVLMQRWHYQKKENTHSTAFRDSHGRSQEAAGVWGNGATIVYMCRHDSWDAAGRLTTRAMASMRMTKAMSDRRHPSQAAAKSLCTHPSLPPESEALGAGRCCWPETHDGVNGPPPASPCGPAIAGPKLSCCPPVCWLCQPVVMLATHHSLLLDWQRRSMALLGSAMITRDSLLPSHSAAASARL